MKEYEIEPQPGLPEPLPKGEQILWQGSPSWRGLLVHALHVRVIIAYFAGLAVWRIIDDLAAGVSAIDVAAHALPILLIGSVPVALAALYAWTAASSALYTITSKRVVMRFGLALPVVLNLPFSKIASAALARHSDGTGDIPLTPHIGPAAGAQVSTLMVWPHVRPWHIWRPEPMLRSLTNPDAVARILSDALAVADAQSPRAVVARAVPAAANSAAARIQPDVPASAASAAAL